MKNWLHELSLLVGFGRDSTGHKEKLLSGLGAAIAICAAIWTGVYLAEGRDYSLHHIQGAFVAASMAASTVLLFAVPHGALSQPWPVVGGHVISAFIGVSCFKLFGQELIAGTLAVGLSVSAMYYLRCIHPPGAATALAAVVGGEMTGAQGYLYILFPILSGAAVLVAVAFLFNYFLGWRRYPAHLFYKNAAVEKSRPADREFEITQEDFFAAIQQHGSFVDVTEEGFTELLELAKQHAEMNVEHPREIIAGRFYSNGKIGRLWSIRQIIDAAETGRKPRAKQVIYKTVAGNGGYATGICSEEEFRQWARFEVVNHDKLWVKAG